MFLKGTVIISIAPSFHYALSQLPYGLERCFSWFSAYWSWRCVALPNWKWSREKIMPSILKDVEESSPQYILLTNSTNSEKRPVCNYLTQMQKTRPAALKNRNQEKRNERSETDLVKINIHVWICYSWVLGYGKWQRRPIL